MNTNRVKHHPLTPQEQAGILLHLLLFEEPYFSRSGYGLSTSKPVSHWPKIDAAAITSVIQNYIDDAGVSGITLEPIGLSHREDHISISLRAPSSEALKNFQEICRPLIGNLPHVSSEQQTETQRKTIFHKGVKTPYTVAGDTIHPQAFQKTTKRRDSLLNPATAEKPDTAIKTTAEGHAYRVSTDGTVCHIEPHALHGKS